MTEVLLCRCRRTWSVIMVLCQSVINLRDSFYYNPPKATFLLCLLSLALSFICLSSYTYTHTLPNPDITKVWTHLRTSHCYIMSKLIKHISVIHFNFSVGLESASLILIRVPAVYESDCEFWACCTDFLSGDKQVQFKHFYKRTCHHSAPEGPSGCDCQFAQWLTGRPWITNYPESWATVPRRLDCIGLFFWAWPKPLTGIFICPSGIELVNLTLQFSCGVGGYTCLTISAPVHILPIDM